MTKQFTGEILERKIFQHAIRVHYSVLYIIDYDTEPEPYLCLSNN